MVYSIGCKVLTRQKHFFHDESGAVVNTVPADVGFKPGKYWCMVQQYGERSFRILRVVCKEVDDKYAIDDWNDGKEVLRLIKENECPFVVFENQFRNRKY